MSWCKDFNNEEADCLSLSLLCQVFCELTLSCDKCFKTCVEVKLPFRYGSCEIKLWKFYLSSSPRIGCQIFKSWTYVNIRCDLFETCRMTRMISTSVWLWSRLLIAANEKWERMGCGWMLCFIHMMDLQSSFFKMTMATNNELMLKEVLGKNPVNWLWAKITSFPIFKIKISKFTKLV